jgi:3-oxoacyl-[acyl-carrier-protein] synthase-3
MSIAASKSSGPAQAVTTVVLRGVAGVLPPRRLSLDELAAAGKLASTPQTLAELGFAGAHVVDAGHDLKWLAREAARRSLVDANLAAKDIDAIIWASALPQDHLLGPWPAADGIASQQAMLGLFRYPSGWLQDELEMDQAVLLAVAQQGCVSMFAALNVARNMLSAEPEKQHVLCLGVDVLPPRAPREILYNLISDASCAVIVSRQAPRDRWLAYHQVSKGFYWDTPARQKEILAAYFPTAKLTIDQLLHKANVAPDEIDVVIPSGVQRSSWEILLDLVGIPADRLDGAGESFGHSLVADNFLLLEKLRRRDDVPAGARMLLFTYGFGSSWSGLLLEH